MLPSRYAWLAREPGPKMIVEALKLYATMEKPGSTNNPTTFHVLGGNQSDRVCMARVAKGRLGDAASTDHAKSDHG